MVQEFFIKDNDAYQTVLKFVRKTYKAMSLTLLYKLFRLKKVKVNGQVMTNMKYQLQIGDRVQIYGNLAGRREEQVQGLSTIKSKITFDIVYEDEYILIVDKPHNVIMHHPHGDSLDLAIRQYLPQNASYSFTISHVHRLDKLTSGLVIYAKQKIALNILHELWNTPDVITKKYLANVATTKTLPIKVTGYLHHDEKLKRMVLTKEPEETSKFVSTKFKLLRKDHGMSWYEIELVTGRKHQIRATCAALQAPIVGDLKYGSLINLGDRIELIAYELEFNNLPAPLDYLNTRKFFVKDVDKLLK